MKEMNEALSTPDFVAGHSLGEYTSLVAAGALDTSDAVRLVRRRGELMQEASGRYPGGMAAILGLDEFVVEELCEETGARIANVNSETQIVISGDRLALARAVDLATARGARRTVILPVSGAFHSTLMWPAREGLVDAVDKTVFHAPKIPVVGNVTAMPIKQVKAAKEELLNQLCHCVQWKNSVQYMAASGVSSFIEFGPGKVLSGLIKRIDKDVKVTNVNDMTSASDLSATTAT
jgi:[acyl-carrier-protein] S-malonyltransferase